MVMRHPLYRLADKVRKPIVGTYYRLDLRKDELEELRKLMPQFFGKAEPNPFAGLPERLHPTSNR